MTEFGPNGTVIGPVTDTRDYASAERPRIRNVLLACFLCGIAASVLVALIGAVIAFLYSSIMSVAGLPQSPFGPEGGFLSGAFIAVMMAAFNWYLFYIVVPVTWLVLLFSIGMFPRRGIRKHAAYYRWGGIWGALLVGGTTAVFGASMAGGATLGAGLTGLMIGGVAGLACASLFLAIVRPQQQIAEFATDVF